MTYSIDELTRAYASVHLGAPPNAATQDNLKMLSGLTNGGQVTNAQALSIVLNGADDNTALAIASYQFFTGKSPTKDGLAYLVNSPANDKDLSDPYYSKFNLENRYINFAANLGVNGEGAKAFADKYGAMSFDAYVASIYETIIGAKYANAAGIDANAAIAYLIGTKDNVLTTARDAGMITADMTTAQVDIALKAAMAGLVMAASIKSDIGLYAAAANNMMVAMVQGTATYHSNITVTYAPDYATASHGTGKAVDRDMTIPESVVVTPPAPPSSLTLRLTTGTDTLTGRGGNDTFNADDYNGTDNIPVFTAGDVLDGGLGNDTLDIISNDGPTYVMPVATVRNIETANIRFRGTSGTSSLDTSSWTGLNTLNVNATGGAGRILVTSATTTDITTTVSNKGSGILFIDGGNDVTVNATGSTGGSIQIGNLSQPTGAIVVHSTSSNQGFVGGFLAQGGTTIDITQVATNAVGTTLSTPTTARTTSPTSATAKTTT